MAPLLTGMLHLPPLPGSPRSLEPLDTIERRVAAEAKLLAEAGFGAAILENYGDVPFTKDDVEPITVAAMTRLAVAVSREAPSLTLGINVLRNDALSALAVAAATGAAFLRVNVHVGATATDQGIVEGRAAATLRKRRELGASVAVWADVQVKHGRSLAHESIEDEAEDALERGLADALIVSGKATGRSTSLDDLRRVKERAGPVPVYVGSGVTEESVRDFLRVADGVIVGTSLKKDGRTTSPIDPDRARRFVERALR